MRIVLDTNALVSGILAPHGPPAAVLRALLTGGARLCFDRRILSECRVVLTGGTFAFDPDLVDELLEFLELAGEPVIAGPLDLRLPDPTDGKFIEVAISARVDALVTANLGHFPPAAANDVSVTTPREFLARLTGT